MDERTTNDFHTSPPPMPDTYLVWAILTTILCCMPLGVVSIVYAAQVESIYFQGDYNKALSYSNKAKTWAICSAAVGAVVIVAYIICMFAYGIFLKKLLEF